MAARLAGWEAAGVCGGGRQLEREGLGAWVRAVPITRQQAGQPLLRC